MTDGRLPLTSFTARGSVYHNEDDPVVDNDSDTAGAVALSSPRCPLGQLSCPPF